MKQRAYLLTLVLVLASAAAARSQSPEPRTQSPADQEPARPTQPQQRAKTPEGSEKKDQDQPPLPPVVAGTSYDAPLTGASQPIIGLVSSRSYILPSVFFYGQLDSNAFNVFGSGNFASINTLMGSIAVQKVGRTTQLNLGYLAGRSISNRGGVLDSTMHDLAVSEMWSRGRWDGFILDKFLYSSQAALLGGATPFEVERLNTVAGLADTGPVVLRNSFLPGQGIFTAFGPRLNNALVAQVNNHLSRRTFFTVVGNYNILSFFHSNLIDSASAGLQTGIGYQRSRKDTFAVVYRFNDLWFSGLPVSVRDNVFEAAYQRQLGERLLFQAGAGPEISFIQAPMVSGTTQSQSSDTRVSWTADALLHYQLRRDLGFSAGYTHALTNGGGVFLGAITDRVSAGVNLQVSRDWTVSVTSAYAHNQNLIPLPNATTATVAAPANATFDSIYGGFEARRRVGRDSEIFFGYLGRYQTASFTFCPAGICQGNNIVGHQFNFGFAWHLRAVPIG